MSSQSQPNKALDDTVARINFWLNMVEERTQLLLTDSKQAQIEPAKAADLTAKFVMIILRLLDKRAELTGSGNDDMHKALLHELFGKDSASMLKHFDV